MDQIKPGVVFQATVIAIKQDEVILNWCFKKKDGSWVGWAGPFKKGESLDVSENEINL